MIRRLLIALSFVVMVSILLLWTFPGLVIATIAYVLGGSFEAVFMWPVLLQMEIQDRLENA